MSNSYGIPDESVNLVSIDGYINAEGRLVLTNKDISSPDFDGYIQQITASIAVSEAVSGQLLELDGTFFPITYISRQDAEISGSAYTGEHILYYLDGDEEKSVTYSSSNTQIAIIKEDWDNKYLGTRGWIITQEGNVIVSNIAARGRIEALEGFIGNEDSGWEISSNLLSNASVGFYAPSAFVGSDIAIFSGSPFDNRATAPFRVNYSGQMNATGASISGALTATTLDVGGSAGIVYDGTTVTIGSSVVINSSLTTDSLQVGASPSLLKIANNVSGSNSGIFISSANYWYSTGDFSLGGPQGITFGGGSVVIGTDVYVNAGVTVNALTVGTAPTLLNISASSGGAGNDGIFINANNYWYTDGRFSVGGSANNVIWSGSTLAVTGNINATTITASNGTIAGFTLSNNQFSIPGITFSSSGGLRLGNPVTFSVDQNGNMVATSASISGDITANSGRFTGSISAQYITASVGEIAGFTLARSQLSTASVVVSSSGGFRLGNPVVFSVDQFGNLSATSASIVGDIRANSGSIGGWTLNPGLLTGTNASIVSGGDIILGSGQNIVRLSSSDSNFRLWAGSATPSTAPFRVTSTGGLVATSASIIGNIVATSGSFSGDITAAAGRFTGSVSVNTGGIIYAGNLSGQRTVLSDQGLFGFHSNGIEAFALPVTGSPRLGTFKIIPTGIVSQSASNANMIYGDVDGSGNVTDGIVIRGFRSSTASIAIYNVKNGTATDFITGNGFYIDENANFKLKGATGSLSFDGNDLYIDGNINARSGRFTGSVSAQHITASTGVVGGFSLSASTLSASSSIGGTIEISSTGAITLSRFGLLTISAASPTYAIWTGNDPVTSPFSLTYTGELKANGATFNNAIVSGSISAQIITASNGIIGGYSLSASTIAKNGVGISTGSTAIFAGAVDDQGTSAQFRVTNTGSIFANAASITGNISATNITSSVGNIGGFVLSASSLTASNSTTTAVGITTGASAIFAGATSRTGGGARFWVSNAGILNASAAIISGDSSINGTNIGNGGGNIASNLRIGANALSSNTTGYSNVALGDNVLASNTTGATNIGIGLSALTKGSGVFGAIAIGASAMASATNGSIGIGFESLFFNTGFDNIGIGGYALRSNKSGANNIAIGPSSMVSNTTGYNNIAIGESALNNNTTGNYNVAIGRNSLLVNTTGSGNVSINYDPGSVNRSIYIANGDPSGLNTLGLWIDGNLNTTLYGNLTVNTNTLFVDATNNEVGIGTVSPASALHVVGNALITSNLNVDSGTFYVDATNNAVNVGTTSHLGAKMSVLNDVSGSAGLLIRGATSQSAPVFTIQDSSGATKVNITAAGAAYFDGNFGIGVGNPSTKLDVDGSALIRSNASVTGNLLVDTNTLFVDATNNRVGIGTTNPNQTLTVVGTASITSTLNVGSTTTISSTTGRVSFGLDAGGNVNIGRTDNVASTPFIDFNSGSVSGDFDVRMQATGGAGATSGRGDLAITASTVTINNFLNVDSGTLYVDSVNNRVGVNTTAPNQSLAVVGTASITSTLDVGGATTITGLLQTNRNVTGGTVRGIQVNATNGYTTNWNAIEFTRQGVELGYIRVASALGAPTLVSASDYRLKKNIEDDNRDFIKTITGLRPVSFEWNSPNYGGKTYGFIAHEVQEYIPEAVGGIKDAVDENGNIVPQDLTQQPFVYYLVGAFKQSIKEIEILKAKVVELESKINQLGGNND